MQHPVFQVYSGHVDFARTFFVTTVTAQRRALFRCESAANLLLETLLEYRSRQKYLLHEFVIMPDHLHALITPASDVSLERAIQFIKGGFSYRLRSRFTVWQPSFTNHRIRSADDFEQHAEYIHMNPVRAGIVAEAGQYLYSSAGRSDKDAAPQGLKPLGFGT